MNFFGNFIPAPTATTANRYNIVWHNLNPLWRQPRPSPSQVTQRSTGVRIRVHSFCTLAFELLTGDKRGQQHSPAFANGKLGNRQTHRDGGFRTPPASVSTHSPRVPPTTPAQQFLDFNFSHSEKITHPGRTLELMTPNVTPNVLHWLSHCQMSQQRSSHL